MVRRIVSGATHPSVMALFFTLQNCQKCCVYEHMNFPVQIYLSVSTTRKIQMSIGWMTDKSIVRKKRSAGQLNNKISTPYLPSPLL